MIHVLFSHHERWFVLSAIGESLHEPGVWTYDGPGSKELGFIEEGGFQWLPFPPSEEVSVQSNQQRLWRHRTHTRWGLLLSKYQEKFGSIRNATFFPSLCWRGLRVENEGWAPYPFCDKPHLRVMASSAGVPSQRASSREHGRFDSSQIDRTKLEMCMREWSTYVELLEPLGFESWLEEYTNNVLFMTGVLAIDDLDMVDGPLPTELTHLI